MLFLHTIEPKTLELLTRLQQEPAFQNLRLVGGTGLALQYGHRKSIDIDLFGKIDIECVDKQLLKMLDEAKNSLLSDIMNNY